MAIHTTNKDQTVTAVFRVYHNSKLVSRDYYEVTDLMGGKPSPRDAAAMLETFKEEVSRQVKREVKAPRGSYLVLESYSYPRKLWCPDCGKLVSEKLFHAECLQKSWDKLCERINKVS